MSERGMRYGQHVELWAGPGLAWAGRGRFLRTEQGRHWWQGEQLFAMVAVRFAGRWVRVRYPWRDVRPAS